MVINSHIVTVFGLWIVLECGYYISYKMISNLVHKWSVFPNPLHNIMLFLLKAQLKGIILQSILVMGDALS